MRDRLRHPAQVFCCLIAAYRPEAEETRYAAHRSLFLRCADLGARARTHPVRFTRSFKDSLA